MLENALRRNAPFPPVTPEVLLDIYNKYTDTTRNVNSTRHEQRSLGFKIHHATNDLEKAKLREEAKQLSLELGEAKQNLDRLEEQLLSYFIMIPTLLLHTECP